MAAKSLGYFQGTSLATARTLADIKGSAAPVTSDYCIVQAESQACRWRMDGTSPTAAIGNTLAVGDTLIVRRSQYGNFKIIEQTASAKVNIEFFKTG